MATTTHPQSRDARRRAAGSVLARCRAPRPDLPPHAPGARTRPWARSPRQRARTTSWTAGYERLLPTNRPTVEAAFPRESYSPGNVARLDRSGPAARHVSLQVFRAGTEDEARSGARRHARHRRDGDSRGSETSTGARNPDACRRVAERALLREARVDAAARSVTHPSFCVRGRSASSQRRRGPVDDDVAGLQLPRRRPNGSLDTWYAGQPHARLGPPVREPRCHSALQALRRSRSCAG